MESPILIERSDELADLVEELAGVPHIAVDTESNSFHAYHERICLIQISTDRQDYIIDPLALEDLAPLGEVFADPCVEKIFHAASNDVLGFKRDGDLRIRSLFDTYLAARLLGYEKLGLASLLDEHFHIRLNKKWQRCNWAKRPLSSEQLQYARLDTRYLIPLRRLLARKLREERLEEEATELFARACEQESQERVFQPDGYLHIKGARRLGASGKRILASLFLYREQEARRRDKAPFRVLSNAVLLNLARHRPRSMEDLQRIKGLPRSYRKVAKASELLALILREEDRPLDGESGGGREETGAPSWVARDSVE